MTGVEIINVPIDEPTERHTECGDLIEFIGEDDGPCCKTCGEVPQHEVEIS